MKIKIVYRQVHGGNWAENRLVNIEGWEIFDEAVLMVWLPNGEARGMPLDTIYYFTVIDD